MEIFEKNLNNVIGSNKRLESKRQNFLQNRFKYSSNTAKSEYSFWLQSNTKSISLPQVAIRTEARYQDYKSEVLRLPLGHSVEQYIDLASEDPHQLSFLCDLYDIAIKNNIPLERTDTVAMKPLNTLISIGVGSGKMLRSCIEELQPYNLNIIVSDHSELATCFDIIDFQELHLKYSKKPFSLNIERVTDRDSFLGALLKFGICSSDLAQVLTYPECEIELCQHLDALIEDKTIANILTYTGFTVDEYNMMLNSVESLARQPQMFARAATRVGGNAIVCGSGPSLDDNINYIKDLSAECTIIAAGSNYSTLRKNNIRVDYLTLNERSYDTFTDYQKVISEFGRDSSTLIMSTTCPGQLIDLFDSTIVYFRPVLTPLAIFGTESEVLSFEGPESVNTGFSFAESLGFDQIFLFGVDLGSAELERKRSTSACGFTPRKFDITAAGNLREHIYTMQSLLDTKVVIEKRIESSDHKKNVIVFNSSDGLKIDHTHPCLPNEVINKFPNASVPFKESVRLQALWKNGLYTYTESRLRSSWKSMYPRRTLSAFSNALEKAVDEFTLNTIFPTALHEIDKITSLNVELKEQFPRRLWRSTVMKSTVAVVQQVNMFKAYATDQQVKTYLKDVRIVFKSLSEKLRQEGLLLCDKIDSILTVVQKDVS